MAAKRVTQSSVNWSALGEHVPANQKPFFAALKARSDGYLRRVMANPEAPPKLDFATYKKKIPVAGLVDNFQKQYEAFKVPYPADTMSSAIAAQEKEAASQIQSYIAESKKRIEEYQAKIKKWDSVIPYEQMTMEDFKDAHPDIALDALNKPTFWPHTPEEQLDYKPPEITAEK